MISAVFGFLGGLLGKLIGLVAPMWIAYRAGKKAGEADRLKDTLDVKDKQLDIANRRRLDRDELLKRMWLRQHKDGSDMP